MTDRPEVPDIPAHKARDRVGKIAGHTAYDITRALVESGVPDDGAVVLHTDGPHRSISELERLLDEALLHEERHADPDRHANPDRHADPDRRVPDEGRASQRSAPRGTPQQDQRGDQEDHPADQHR